MNNAQLNKQLQLLKERLEQVENKPSTSSDPSPSSLPSSTDESFHKSISLISRVFNFYTRTKEKLIKHYISMKAFLFKYKIFTKVFHV